MAIKLPVRVDPPFRKHLFDADGELLVCVFTTEEDTDEIATALNERTALIAERDRLREALAEMVAASDPDAPDDDEAGFDRCLRAIKAARAALGEGK